MMVPDEVDMEHDVVKYGMCIVKGMNVVKGEKDLSRNEVEELRKEIGELKKEVGEYLLRLLWVVLLYLIVSQAITGCPPSQTISMVQAVAKSRLACVISSYNLIVNSDYRQ